MLQPDAGPDDALIAVLDRWDVGAHAHLDGSLRTHLLGVHGLLESWGARPALRYAGLFHAVDGTQHFQSLIEREPGDLARVIGTEAATIIATYTGCSRDKVWPQIGRVQPVIFHDTHGNARDPLSDAALRDFCELTMANELEILARDRAHRDAFAPLFRELLSRMQPFVSEPARHAFDRILGERESLPERCGRWIRRGQRALSRRARRFIPIRLQK